jgi:hypothetical protein
MKTAAFFVSGALALLLVAACATMGLSFDQRWAVAHAINTGVRSVSTAATTSKAITKTEAQRVLALNDEASKLLNEAEAARKTDPKLAEAKLSLAMDVLKGTQTYLETRGVKVPVTTERRKK